MSNDDLIIAKALNAGMRRLLVAAFVHENETAPASKQMIVLHEAFKREIARLVMRGKTVDGDDVVLTTTITMWPLSRATQCLANTAGHTPRSRARGPAHGRRNHRTT